MKKLKAFNVVELTIVVSLMLATVMLCVPVIFNNTKEAKIISNWKKSYAEMQSNFEVFAISDKENIENVCASNENIKDKDKEIFKIIGPYLNVDASHNTQSLKHYHYKFKNGSHIPMQSQFFTKLYAFQENENIVIFKWITCQCNEKTPCATVFFDMNGTQKPNRIGSDIFGFYLYKDKLETFGANLSNAELIQSCNAHSNGLNCSEYYLRGGKF